MRTYLKNEDTENIAVNFGESKLSIPYKSQPKKLNTLKLDIRLKSINSK